MSGEHKKSVAIIGGGAAGFFAAISCKTQFPSAKVTIYEKSNKLLAKVKVSGGGRCNVTNACESTAQFAKSYPRGSKQMKKAFGQFNRSDTIQWFETQGVSIKVEPDGRMFPVTNDSQTIIDSLLDKTRKLGIQIRKGSHVKKIKNTGDSYLLNFNDQTEEKVQALIIATGGSPKLEGLKWLKDLGHSIEPPVPSLFTFNMPSENITELMGLVAQNVVVRIEGTKLVQEGPLLITHWGMSGPAILKLSAWGARVLHDKNYRFAIHINWLNKESEQDFKNSVAEQQRTYGKRKVLNHAPYPLPKRLWLYLIAKTGISEETTWADIGKKSINRLTNYLLNDIYQVNGKTTFKEEFVTCGGISLNDVDFKTMQSRKSPGLYFAGEVLDVDGITGGFNFQAAWTTGFIAGKYVLQQYD